MISLLCCRRKRPLFLTIFGFIICFVVFVNLMISQLNSVNIRSEENFVEEFNKISSNSKILAADLLSNDFAINRKVKWINKKAQDISVNIKNNNQDLQNKKYKFQDGNRAENKILVLTKDLDNNPNSVEKDYNINPSVKTDEEYNDDDDDDVIEDTDGSDADDLIDEDTAIKFSPQLQENSVFKDGDFGDISKLKFKKPPFRYEEVNLTDLKANAHETKNTGPIPTVSNNTQPVSNQNNIEKAQTTSAQGINASHIVIKGIFWSHQVEKLIPEEDFYPKHWSLGPILPAKQGLFTIVKKHCFTSRDPHGEQVEEVVVPSENHQEATSNFQIPNIIPHAMHSTGRGREVGHVHLSAQYISAQRQRVPTDAMGSLSNSDVKVYKKSIDESHVKVLQTPKWNKCGRPRNAYVIFSDGTQACARYKDPHNRYILGEVLCFYLSRLIRLDNVPAVVLSRVSNTSTIWKGTSYQMLKWEEGKLVALIQWINDIVHSKWAHVKMPTLILKALQKNLTVDSKMIREAAMSEGELRRSLLEIAQWGSMIIFDYLTGNYDRVASMQDAAEKENKPSIIQEHIRNLWKSEKGKLWLIDNESGLLDSYDLLYASDGESKKFTRYHRTMLQTMCIFQKPVVKALKKLHYNGNPHIVLEQYARQHEKLLDDVPKHHSYKMFVRYFGQRLKEVVEWINYCETRR